MIRYKTGNILLEEADAITNTVNCVGVMGRGIALQFKNAFPDNFISYKKACDAKAIEPGKMFIFDTQQLTKPRYIVNFPTKRHWRGHSRIEDIDAGLDDLVSQINALSIRSIAIPPLGSGLGGLEWTVVKQHIEDKLSVLEDVDIIIYEPQKPSDNNKSTTGTAVPQMTPGRAVLVELINRYQNGLLNPFISLIEVHKLMYFVQEGGEALRLQYTKAPYGPYAENLRHVLNAIEGHLITGYADGGDQPHKELSLVPGAVKNANAFLANHSDTLARFDKVSRLVEGFESPWGLELLSTVHWVAIREGASTVDDITQKVHDWSERKQQFTPRQIQAAIDVLSKEQWLGDIAH